MIKVKNYSTTKESFEYMLKKFRNKTTSRCKELDQNMFFEKECVGKERIRRKWKKEKRKDAALKKKYGLRYWEQYKHVEV